MAGGTVKYVTVRDHLAGRISTMAPGDRIPAEQVLCDEYGVSRITIRRAVDDLIQDGRLVREQGRGTFVTEPRYTQHVREAFAEQITGFHRQQALLGREVTTKVLQNHVVRERPAAVALGLSPADEVIELERLRYVNGNLHQHVVTYLPAARYPGVLAHDFTGESLFDYLQQTYGVTLVRNDLLVRLDRAAGNVAEAMKVVPGEAVLAIDSTVYTGDDTPVAFGVAIHTPDNSEISFSLRNQGAMAVMG